MDWVELPGAGLRGPGTHHRPERFPCRGAGLRPRPPAACRLPVVTSMPTTPLPSPTVTPCSATSTSKPPAVHDTAPPTPMPVRTAAAAAKGCTRPPARFRNGIVEMNSETLMALPRVNGGVKLTCPNGGLHRAVAQGGARAGPIKAARRTTRGARAATSAARTAAPGCAAAVRRARGELAARRAVQPGSRPATDPAASRRRPCQQQRHAELTRGHPHGQRRRKRKARREHPHGQRRGVGRCQAARGAGKQHHRRPVGAGSSARPAAPVTGSTPKAGGSA